MPSLFSTCQQSFKHFEEEREKKMRKTTRNELDKYLKIKQEPREHREEAQQVRSETRLRFAVIEMKLVFLFLEFFDVC